MKKNLMLFCYCVVPMLIAGASSVHAADPQAKTPQIQLSPHVAPVVSPSDMQPAKKPTPSPMQTAPSLKQESAATPTAPMANQKALNPKANAMVEGGVKPASTMPGKAPAPGNTGINASWPDGY